LVVQREGHKEAWSAQEGIKHRNNTWVFYL
jgi:hypothetical protein